MKKIIFILNGFRLGGITKVNIAIANELNKDYDVAIYNTGKENKSRFSVKTLVYQEKYHFVNLAHFLPRAIKKVSQHTRIPINPNRLELGKISKLCQYIEKEQINVVVLNAAQITYATEIKKKFPDVVVIGWLHNNAEVYLNKFFRSYRKYFIAAVNTIDFLVCLTNTDQKSFEAYTDNAICIYNPVTISVKNRSKLDNQIISFVGRIDIEQKGIDYLCKIAQNIPNGWKIAVAGPGKKRNKKTFEKLQLKYQTDGKLEYMGSLKGKALKKHYRESSIFMMTSRWEGMPLVLMEAMSFGLPIIAFEQSGANEVLDFGKSGVLVKKGSACDFTHELAILTDNVEKRAYYSKASLERVKVFKIKKIIEEWKQMID